jgi:hypothetical protein
MMSGERVDEVTSAFARGAREPEKGARKGRKEQIPTGEECRGKFGK